VKTAFRNCQTNTKRVFLQYVSANEFQGEIVSCTFSHTRNGDTRERVLCAVKEVTMMPEIWGDQEWWVQQQAWPCLHQLLLLATLKVGFVPTTTGVVSMRAEGERQERNKGPSVHRRDALVIAREVEECRQEAVLQNQNIQGLSRHQPNQSERQLLQANVGRAFFRVRAQCLRKLQENSLLLNGPALSTPPHVRRSRPATDLMEPCSE
jgi:hypothetical protein